MSDLATFASHLDEVVNDASRVRHWNPDEADSYMAEIGDRRERFEELAHRLSDSVVRPRLEILAALFPNALVSKEQLIHSLSCQFEYCDRFPAITTVEFSIEHDIRFERLILHTKARIMPVFVRFYEQDNLPLSLDSVNDEEVAEWVEERLLEFLDTYLRIDAVGGELNEQSATDPVCGMQILRTTAVATDSYYGHPYFFCSKDCHERFASDPTQYAQIKTM